MRARHIFLTLVTALVLSGCAPAVDVPAEAGIGTSDLAPSIAPEPVGAKKPDKKPKRHGTKPQDPLPGKGKRTRAGSVGTPKAAATPRASASPAAGPQALSASVTDPSGDVQGSLTKAPAYVDLAGANLTRRDTFELRISFAGAVPARDDGDRIVNVASFYDLDGDGQVDYEVWASLSDTGWSGSYRTPSGARFGSDSGVAARPDGRDLVLTFPLGHLKRASAFRWSVGAEWGTYEQVAAGATAHDTAPDQGVVAFPG